MKGGLGTASLKLGDVIMGALAVVNAAGDIRDWRTGRLIAGPLAADRRVTDSVELMRASLTARSAGALEDPALHSTTLAVVATNVDLTKTSLTKLAMMANCGASRAIRPYHTTGDGDQLFAVSTGSLQRPDVPLTTLGALAADLIADAIVRGVQAAKSVEGWVAVRDL
jgi:L-aminopeptidase/D-esterase-like protein